MNLQGLGKIESAQAYLDMAFRESTKMASSSREGKSKDKLSKSKRIELTRVETVGKVLIGHLDAIVKKFPSIDQLNPFYYELVRATIDVDKLKKSLGALSWAKKQVANLTTNARGDIHTSRTPQTINVKRRAYVGRVSSILERVNTNLAYLEDCRRVMKEYPQLKTGMPTIVIAGMPNVGKSTLLAALTGSAPETAPYPFTTQQLNIGYDPKGRQYVDTPGLLDRPLNKRNAIEKQAILALKHLANLIVFVFDPTEACGYPVPDQQNLLNELKKEFTQPFIIVSNKADTGATFKHAIEVSAMKGIGIDKLKKEINDALSQQEK